MDERLIEKSPKSIMKLFNIPEEDKIAVKKFIIEDLRKFSNISKKRQRNIENYVDKNLGYPTEFLRLNRDRLKLRYSTLTSGGFTLLTVIISLFIFYLSLFLVNSIQIQESNSSGFFGLLLLMAFILSFFVVASYKSNKIDEHIVIIDWIIAFQDNLDN